MGSRRWRRLVRWVVVGTGPLKRGTDRVEMLTRLLVVAAVLCAAPAALLVGASVHGSLLAAARGQAAQRHEVTAVVLTEPPSAVDATASDYSALVDLPVRWLTASGEARVATVPVPDTAHAGDKVPVWLTLTGKPTGAPESTEVVASDSVSIGVAVLLSVPLLAWGVHAATRLLLDVRRARQWQAGWRAVEPVWAPHRW